jgi:hypothetical protein
MKKYIIFLLLVSFISSCAVIKFSKEKRLINTTWKYQDNDKDYEITFLREGKISLTYPNDVTPDNDNWKIKDGKLIFSYNDNYVTYTEITSTPSEIRGVAINIRNKKWDWVLTKK